MYFYNINEDVLKDIYENRTLVLLYPVYTRTYAKNGIDRTELSQYMIYGKNHSETQEASNFRKLAKTDCFLYEFLKSRKYDFENYKSKTPLINDFLTGEVKDRPGVFLNFDNPDTLNDQIAEICHLTMEEQEIMREVVKPWRDKLSSTVNELC